MNTCALFQIPQYRGNCQSSRGSVRARVMQACQISVSGPRISGPRVIGTILKPCQGLDDSARMGYLNGNMHTGGAAQQERTQSFTP